MLTRLATAKRSAGSVRATAGTAPAGAPGRPRLLRPGGKEAGMTTAEYSVGTIAACGFGGVLYKLLTSDWVVKLLGDIIKRALSLNF